MIDGKRQDGMLTIIITLLWRTTTLLAVVSSCSINCSTSTTAILADAYVLKNTNKNRNIIINNSSPNNGNISRIRQRSDTRHYFPSLTMTLTSEDYRGNNEVDEVEVEHSTEAGTATTMENLIQSKLDGCLDHYEISNIVRHQPKTMNLNKSILSSQEEILIKQIEVATTVLDWFLSTSGLFTVSQAASIVKDHPPILSYGIEKNVIPTIKFYNDSLLKLFPQRQSTTIRSNSNTNNNEDDNGGDDNIIAIDIIDPRTVAFLCENPKLFEFNIKKRLKPRFDAYQKIMEEIATITIDNHHQDESSEADDDNGVTVISAEDTLKNIATKTDSRFEEWLQELKRRSFQEEEEITEEEELVVMDEDTNTIISEEQQHHDDVPSYSSYVILSNLQSGMNIGNILRSASIFGCTECIVVGQKRHRLTGDHGSRFDLPRRHFYTHAEAKEYLLKQQQGNDATTNTNAIKIYGVEIMDNASPLMKYDAETGVVTFPFGDRRQQVASNGAAFVMGNEGLGLSERQKEICDDFIYIPQARGGGGTSSTTSRDAKGNGRGSASLNVSCAAAIILHAYSLWADYPVATIEGEKFVAT